MVMIARLGSIKVATMKLPATIMVIANPFALAGSMDNMRGRGACRVVHCSA
jgi:hypothetical protein